MLKTENDTIISVISNLCIDSMLVNEYLLFAHFVRDLFKVSQIKVSFN